MNVHEFPWQKGRNSKERQASVEQTLISFYSIGELLRFTAKAILDDGRPLAVIAREAKVCSSTVSHLARGATRFPRCESILRILSAVGYRLTVRS
jgi:hypothetical protein